MTGYTLTVLHSEPALRITIALDADNYDQAHKRSWHFQTPHRVDGPLHTPEDDCDE